MSWRPSASLETLKLRATWLQTIRQFFQDRGVLEVETPVLSTASVPDPHIESLRTQVNNQSAFLQTSPELYMKRLLAAGSGPIYQLARVFRDGEQGRLHNPEFTLVEWYRPGFDQQQLMHEVIELVAALCDLGPADKNIQTLTYQQLFEQSTLINPHQQDWVKFKEYLAQYNYQCPEENDWQAAMDWLLSTVIQPTMTGFVFVTDYPASQASLARLDPDNSMIARRFELFINGIEIANGFEELLDANEQRERFINENKIRLSNNQQQVPLDEKFLSALEAGVPETSGVALGLDRLLMWKLGGHSVSEVMAFS